MIRRTLSRLKVLLGGSQFRRELEEEMAFHLDRLTEELVREGMSPKEARREALLRFGSPERVQDRSREARGLGQVDEMVRNVRFAFRSMVRNPVFSMTFVLTLALCIGLGTAVFSVVDAVLWRALPYPNPDQLAVAELYDPARGPDPNGGSVDGRTWERIRDQAGFLERAVYSDWATGVNLSTDAAAAYVQQQRVGAGYFETLGVPPQMGRDFTPAEDVPDGPPVAILSNELWTRTFQRDPDILGSTLRLKGEAYTVVGVMPPDFRSNADADVWTPLAASTTGEGGGTNYSVLVRVPAGMSFQEADARMAGIQPPQANQPDAPQLRFGLLPLETALSHGVRVPLLVLLGAIGIMLLVGCANLAGLQIARTLARRMEMATRQAMGSGAGALTRQMLTENILLGLVGGLAGLVVAYFAVDGLEALAQAHFGTWQPVHLDGRALGAALGLTVLATFLFGLAPVLQVRKAEIQRVLVTGSRSVTGGGGHLARKTLLVGQVAMVTALLFAAGLLVRSQGYLEGLDPGFDPDGVLTVQFSLDDARYAEGESVQRLFSESLERLLSLPEVASAAVALTLPYERPLNLPFHLPRDEPGTSRVANVVYVTPGFFETLEIPVLAGRGFEDADRADAPAVAVANRAFVEAHFPDADGIGNSVVMGMGGAGGMEIVGVVGNVQQSAGWGATNDPVWETPTLYLPAAQADGSFFSIVHVWFSPSWIIRATASQGDLAARVTQVFRTVDPDLPVARMATLKEVMKGAFARQRFETAFLLIVAAFALLLAGVGLYGIVAHDVQVRRGEMGIRMALGSTPKQAIWAAGIGGIRLTGIGLVVGGVLTVLVARIMGHLIYGVGPYDPVTMVLLALILLLIASVASFVPATRIGRMDPAMILRES